MNKSISIEDMKVKNKILHKRLFIMYYRLMVEKENDIREPIIWVVGSLNADLVQRVNHFPAAGETLSGGDLETFPGGKGANQACAAARLGATVKMIGNVGDDELGSMLLESLKDAGVDTNGIARINISTGAATIFVLENGENAIVISAGANGKLAPADVRVRLQEICSEDILLCQLETPRDTVLEALKIAKNVGATTVLDPAPAGSATEEILSAADILTPNETEVQTILCESEKTPVDSQSVRGLSKRLLACGPGKIVLKLGDAGCHFDDGTTFDAVSGFDVNAIDTTGAGDTFNGALAVKLGEGCEMKGALRFANAAAAISVTRSGAQTSIPNRIEVEEFMTQSEKD